MNISPIGTGSPTSLESQPLARGVAPPPPVPPPTVSEIAQKTFSAPPVPQGGVLVGPPPLIQPSAVSFGGSAGRGIQDVGGSPAGDANSSTWSDVSPTNPGNGPLSIPLGPLGV